MTVAAVLFLKLFFLLFAFSHGLILGATRIFGSEIKQQSVSSDGMHLSRFHRDLSVAFLPPGDLLGDHKISKENEKYMGRKFGSRSIVII